MREEGSDARIQNIKSLQYSVDDVGNPILTRKQQAPKLKKHADMDMPIFGFRLNSYGDSEAD